MQTLFIIFIIVSAFGILFLLWRKMPQIASLRENKDWNGVKNLKFREKILNGNGFKRMAPKLEKGVRRFRLAALRADNLSLRWIGYLRKKSRAFSDVTGRMRPKNHSSDVHSEKFNRIKTVFHKEADPFPQNGKNKDDSYFVKLKDRLKTSKIKRQTGSTGNLRTGLLEKESELIAAIMKNPKNANLYRRLGDVYYINSRWEEARECFMMVRKFSGSVDPDLLGKLETAKSRAGKKSGKSTRI